MSGIENPATRYFVDSNIWLYAFIEAQDPAKSATARRLIQTAEIVVSTQVINEVSSNLIRKAGFTEPQIRQLIDSYYNRYAVIVHDQSVLLQASELRQRYQLSYWDSQIVAAALSAGVDVIWSEDMDTGLRINPRLRILNPLTSSPPA